MRDIDLSHTEDTLFPVPVDFSIFSNKIEMIIMLNNCLMV